MVTSAQLAQTCVLCSQLQARTVPVKTSAVIAGKQAKQTWRTHSQRQPNT